MSAFGPGDGKVPEHGGKTFKKQSVKSRDTRTQSPYLGMRMREDDSDAVNMSDTKLGGGIRQTGSAK